jgi:hypothetical protein
MTSIELVGNFLITDGVFEFMYFVKEVMEDIDIEDYFIEVALCEGLHTLIKYFMA